EVEARTLGLSIHQPAIAAGRSYEVVPYYGIPAIPSDPFDGSALIVWDSGTATPPTTNTPPRPGRCSNDATRECSVNSHCAAPAGVRVALSPHLFRGMLVGMAAVAVAIHRTTGNRDLAWRFAKGRARTLAWLLGVQVTLRGLDHIAGGGPFVFTPNHQSHLD